jgi:hypothetical protein
MKGKPKDQRNDMSPGPGYYEPKEELTKPNNSINFKQSASSRADLVSKEVMNKPGPGMYANNYKTVGKDAQSFTIG